MSAARRVWPASITAATAFAVIAVAVVAALLAARFDARLDLTAGGEQSLAPRLSGAIGRAAQAGGASRSCWSPTAGPPTRRRGARWATCWTWWAARATRCG